MWLSPRPDWTSQGQELYSPLLWVHSIYPVWSLPSASHHCCSVAKLCPILWDSKDCSTPVSPVFHHFHEFGQTHVHCGEGNGNPLHCSCLENPMDRGAWWAAVYGVAQSRTQLKRLSSSSSSNVHISVLFCQINPPSPSPTESKSLLFTSVSPLLPACTIISTVFLNSIYTRFLIVIIKWWHFAM